MNDHKILFLYQGKNSEGYDEQRHIVFDSIRAVAEDRPQRPGEFYYLDPVDTSFFKLLESSADVIAQEDRRARLAEIEAEEARLQEQREHLEHIESAYLAKLDAERDDDG